MTTRLSGALRMALGAVVACVPLAAGCLHRSPWIVALLSPVFTILYAAGKWSVWRPLWRVGGSRAILGAGAATLPIQAMVAGVLYLIGLGLAGLFAPGPTRSLSGADAWASLALLVVALGSTALLTRLEAPRSPTATSPRDVDDTPLELDPAPLTLQTFFVSPGYWTSDVTRDALAGRGAVVEKAPTGASDAMIERTEARLGVRLPNTLRELYRVMNGGKVGTVYVPLRDAARPRLGDWRGAFSIDYSSLVPLEELRTVAEHYSDFTDDPDALPEHAALRIVLQARYGDMTLLDYSRGPHPGVLIVEYDRGDGRDPVDAAFEDFDAFFRALRREKPERRSFSRKLYRSPPLGSIPESDRPARVWTGDRPHPFVDMATYEDAPLPQPRADDTLISETGSRLGVRLPPALVSLWRERNGGEMAYVYVDAPGEPEGEVRLWTHPMPLEYVVSLETLSGRIRFPPGETPWSETFREPGRLIVLEARRDWALLLDYRGTEADPALLVVDPLGAGESGVRLRIGSVDDLFLRLRRHQRPS